MTSADAVMDSLRSADDGGFSRIIDIFVDAADVLILKGISSPLEMWRATQCCRILESAAFRHGGTQDRLVQLGSSRLLAHLTTLLEACGRAHQDRASDALGECIHALLGLLVNMTHMQGSACDIVMHESSSAGILLNMCAAWLRCDSAAGSPWHFDALLRALSVLANCVEMSENNRIALARCTVVDATGNAISSIAFLVDALLDLLPSAKSPDEDGEIPSWSAESLVLSAHVCMVIGCLLRGASLASLQSKVNLTSCSEQFAAEARVHNIAALMPNTSLSRFVLSLTHLCDFKSKRACSPPKY